MFQKQIFQVGTLLWIFFTKEMDINEYDNYEAIGGIQGEIYSCLSSKRNEKTQEEKKIA